MTHIAIELSDIPHGHGLSFKKGVSDGVLDSKENQKSIHETHLASYRKGLIFGEELKSKIAKHVKA